MKFEHYLQKNKDKLQHKVDSDLMWKKIQKDLQPKNTIKYTLISLALFTILIISSLVYIVIDEEKNINNTEQELIALKSKMNDLITDSKTSSRILAVNMPTENLTIDNEIINVLIDRMKNDSSPNVQLAATRALSTHMNEEHVRISMIETLSATRDKYLQLKIIDLLTQEKEKRLLPYLDSIRNTEHRNSILIAPAQRAEKILKEL